MRTIKFRGKTPEGEWVFGLPYFAHGTGSWFITQSNGWIPTYNNPDEGESTEMIGVDAKTVGQFTGLHDKNGKEIYEGDLVKATHPNCQETFTGAVEYNEELALFQLNYGESYDWELSHLDGFEVTGNIHEQ